MHASPNQELRKAGEVVGHGEVLGAVKDGVQLGEIRSRRDDNSSVGSRMPRGAASSPPALSPRCRLPIRYTGRVRRTATG